jgi:L,D-transpeptidase catalytic domain
MRKYLLLLLAVTSTCFSLPYLESLQEKEIVNNVNMIMDKIKSLVNTKYDYLIMTSQAVDDTAEILGKEANTLNREVISKVTTTLQCAKEYNIEHNNILTIIDYSLPSSEKRLWVVDLKEKKLLFHTYVSHGLKSGTLQTTYFSNKHNSKASSVGVYTTEKTYYGRDGLSLRLDGLDKGFNDNASSRAVVIHGGWYVEEDFIKKYGRAGRSWGCPALPLELTKPIINTIKDKSLLVIYYPNDNWFAKSKFLHCANIRATEQSLDKQQTQLTPALPQEENNQREEILFADIKKNNKREENDPIVTMTADSYERIFHNKVPVTRMLRRQINNTEYVALSNTEIKNLVSNSNNLLPQNNQNDLNEIYFVIPNIVMQRGYYLTQMKIVSLGKIKEIKLVTAPSKKFAQTDSYVVQFENNSSINLRPTSQFIRWVGL